MRRQASLLIADAVTYYRQKQEASRTTGRSVKAEAVTRMIGADRSDPIEPARIATVFVTEDY